MPPPIAEPPRRRQILLVDDDAAVRRTLREVLEDQGYAVEEAGTGREALAACRRVGDLAVVVTDIVMPDMEGLELLRILQREDPALPIVVVTGAELPGTKPGTLATVATRLGARRVFRKPFELPAFVAVVRELAAQR